MEIHISDATIEKMAKEAVKARVDAYLAGQRNVNPYYLSDMYRNCISYEVSKIITDEFVQEVCKELCKEHIAEKVIDKFSEKIASCFED